MPIGYTSTLKELLVALPENGSLVALINSSLVKFYRDGSTTYELDLMNACGLNGMSEYGASQSGEIVTIKGDYTCSEDDPMEILDYLGRYLNSAFPDLVIQDRDVVDNIDWHDIVLCVEI